MTRKAKLSVMPSVVWPSRGQYAAVRSNRQSRLLPIQLAPPGLNTPHTPISRVQASWAYSSGFGTHRWATSGNCACSEVGMKTNAPHYEEVTTLDVSLPHKPRVHVAASTYRCSPFACLIPQSMLIGSSTSENSVLPPTSGRLLLSAFDSAGHARDRPADSCGGWRTPANELPHGWDCPGTPAPCLNPGHSCPEVSHARPALACSRLAYIHNAGVYSYRMFLPFSL
mmetsp:Transcript_43420/g.78006  ORF Transcript_43420/g.78006 Transcript_43420/m.78006 type:complete len:226 (+) Transcript_43420:133-810(+)